MTRAFICSADSPVRATKLSARLRTGLSALQFITTAAGSVQCAGLPGALSAEKSELPAKGLAQHDFLYSGEWDTRKTNQTMFLIRGGKVVWTYEIPIKDGNGNLSEFSDMHRLSNGDIVFACKTGWRKIDAAGKTLY